MCDRGFFLCDCTFWNTKYRNGILPNVGFCTVQAQMEYRQFMRSELHLPQQKGEDIWVRRMCYGAV